MNTTIIVALITVFGTTVPQIVSKYLDYRKEITLKKIEVYEKNQKDAIIKFSECVASFMDDSDKELSSNDLVEYYKAACTLFAYFPKLDFSLLTKLGNCLDCANALISEKFIKVITEISKLQSETK